MERRYTIGFLVNPIAGMGGRVGLKGTDNVVDEAIRRGAEPVAPRRALEFLRRLETLLRQEKLDIDIVSCRLNMGEDYIRETGLKATYIDIPGSRETTAEDTREAVAEFTSKNPSLIVFVGGDGTARDVYEGLKSASKMDVPILGVPSGVKIYSGVFAVTPVDAAYIVLEHALGRAREMDLEIMDIDEEAFRSNRLNVKIYGYTRSVYIPFHTQSSKQLSPDSVDEVENQLGIAKYIAEIFDKNGVYILGPGTTVKRIADELGIRKTLLGVDVYYRGEVYNDLSEKEILDLIDDEEAWIIVTPIGRQGILFGRGNQQISPNVIRKVGRDHIIVVATLRKLRDIPGGTLRVDTQDPEVDEYLRGYIKVIIDYRTWRMVKIV